ncbi:MAG: preprotein translocase subunit SecE [Saccharofermentanales bacterium]|jgi:preprotein translocase subunit SecE
MASRKNKRRRNVRDDKPGLGRRIKDFFSDIRAELKRVTWPDRKRLKANTGTVIAIILIASLTIFIFDTVISSVLSRTGFYTYETAESDTQITESVEETDETTPEEQVESETEETTEPAE